LIAMTPLTVDATLTSLSEIGRYVDTVSQAAGLARQEAYNLRLAVDEVATNVIVHGYEEHGLSGTLLLRAETTAESVAVTVEDRGPEFDPRNQAMPTAEELAEPLEDREIGGLGIFLALKSVDEFRYERRGDINVNTFVMRRGARA
jgi:anti-sigma regulatory factor (Ser/Thr protein kinase)